MKSVEDIIKKRRMTAAQLLQHPLIQSRKQRGKGRCGAKGAAGQRATLGRSEIK